MKIVALLHGYPPVHVAGAEMYAHHAFRWFVEQGHTVRVLCPQPMFPDNKQELLLEGVQMISIDACQLDAEIREADIAISHLDLSAKLSTLCRKHGTPCVHFVHNPTSLDYYRLKPTDVDLIVYNSYWLAQAGQKQNFPCRVLYPPVFERDYGGVVNGERTKITLLNSNENKGGKFVDQLARLSPNREFMIVRGAYGHQHTPVSDNVTNHEHTFNAREIYEKTRVLLVPSLHETWGRVAVEAMWAGIPVVYNGSCGQPGLRECVGWAGIQAHRTHPQLPDQHDSWLDALKRLDDPETYQHYVNLGRARAAQLEEETLRQLGHLEKAFLELLNLGKSSRIHAFASEEHYLDHLSPTMRQLHPDQTGYMVVPPELKLRALEKGHRIMVLDFKRIEKDAPFLYNHADPTTSLAYVASSIDQHLAQKIGYFVYRQEHGIGQTYADSDSKSYAGSPQHGTVFGFSAPNRYTARKQKAAHPHILTQTVGLPILDDFPLLGDPPEAVGFCFHWDNPARPETKATWRYWIGAIEKIAKKGNYPILIHAHPRERAKIKDYLRGNRHIGFVDDIFEFHQQVGLVCGDNTSAIYLLAAVGHPVILLNHPDYRRSVEHGLRFWEASDVGLQCDTPQQLEGAIIDANVDREPDEFTQSALQYVFFRQRDASVVQAMLFEKLLEFRRKTTGHGTHVTVEALRNIDTSYAGGMIKGFRYHIPRKYAEQLCASGNARSPQGRDDRNYSWPTKGTELTVHRPRAAGEHLYQVQKEFRHNGITYKPNDFVLKREVGEDFIQANCQVYEAKNKKFPEGMEVK